MSLRELSQSFREHTYWHKDGDTLKDGTLYDGKITSEYAGDNSIPTVTERDDATVVALAAAKKIIIKPPNGTVTIALRFRSDGSADDNNVLQLFTEAGVDHYGHLCLLTVQQGTQIYSTGIYFCDAVTPANEQWYTAVTELTTTSDHIGGYILNTHGIDSIWIVASDLVTTSLYVDWRIV